MNKSIFTLLLLSLVIAISINAYSIDKGQLDGFNTNNNLVFVENVGQITDQRYTVRNDIDYKIEGHGLNLYIGSGALHYQWNYVPNDDEEWKEKVITYRMDVQLLGANPNIRPVTTNPLEYTEQYYLPTTTEGAVASSFSKVIYPNIYPNIDWVLYTHNGKLKYDFILHEGADPHTIKIQYNGADKIDLTNGEISVTTVAGYVTEQAPYSYNPLTNEHIPSEYVLEDNIVSFKLGEYSTDVIIDPSLEWATYYGGTGFDNGYAIANDTSENLYMVGSTQSTTNIATTGSFKDTLDGTRDGYVAKFTEAGFRVWATYYGGKGEERLYSVFVNSQQELIIAGITDTSSNLATPTVMPAVHQANHGGGSSDCILLKLSSGNGGRIWCTYFGGASSESYADDYQAHATCDDNDNIYLTGTTQSDTGIATNNVAQTSRSGKHDAFIAKFDTDGDLTWGTYYGGSEEDIFKKSIIKGVNDVYVVGEFESSGLASSTGVHQSSRKGGKEALLARINANDGTIKWATYYGGTSDDEPRGIGIDALHNLYISGSTQSIADIANPGSHQNSLQGSSDAFLAKFDSTGMRTWGTYFGGNASSGSGTDHGYNLWIDPAGYVLLTGSTSSGNRITTSDAYQEYKGGSASTNGNTDFDAFIAIFDQQGNRTWGSYYGGPSSDYGQDILLQATNHVYLTGKTGSSTIHLSGSQNTPGGLNDAFLAKFTPDTSVFVFQPFTQTEHCEGDTFTLQYGVTTPFRPNNAFTVQLSDATGSFTSPINIGSTNAMSGGNILCTLPSNLTGTQFRIRIVATSPIDTSFDNGNDITIKTLPVKPTASSNSPVCSNDTLKLYSTNSSAGATYLWKGPFNYLSTDQNAIQVAPIAVTSGDYIVSANLNGCSNADTVSVTVLQAPTQPSISTNAPLCVSDSLVLFGSNISTGSSISWSGPNGFSSNMANPPTKYNVSLSDAGYYYLTTQLNTCSSTDSVLVTVAQPPAPVTATSNSPVCSGDDILLTATSTTPPPVSYFWDGPNNYSSTGTNTSRNNASTTHSGDYIVTISLNGCTRKDTVNVNVVQAPDKPIASSNSPICSGETLILNGSDITSGSSTSWTGPNSFTSNNASTSRSNVLVSDSGDYVITSSLNGCNKSDTVHVSISPTIVANLNIQVNPGTTVCPTADLEFIVSHSYSGTSTYTWTGPGGWSSNNDTATIPNAQYSDSGYYKISAQIGQCISGTDSVYLNVVDTISSPVLTTNSPVCFGDSVVITNSHPYINQFTVTYPNNTSYTFGRSRIVRNIDFSYDGMYVSKVSAGGCVAYDTAIVKVNPKPQTPSASSNSPLCESSTLLLNSNSTTIGASYEWTGPNGYTSTLQNPTIGNITLNNDGTYNVRSALNGCYSSMTSVDVKVNPNPMPSIESNTPVCEGDDIELSVTANTDETYSWSKSGSGFSAQGAVLSIQTASLSNAGIYTVLATNTNTGCTGSNSILTEVIALPDEPNITTNNPVCEGDILTLTSIDTSSNVSYQWSGPNGYNKTGKTVEKESITLADQGNYYLRVSRGSCVLTDTTNVLVKETPPEPIVTSNSPLSEGETLELKITNPTAGASYQWRGPNSYGSRLQDPTIANISTAYSGTYIATVSIDGCKSSGRTLVVVESGNLNDEDLIIFPNPNKGKFTIKAKVRYDQVMAFEIVNSVGMIVFDDKADAVDLEMETQVNIQDYLPSGVYFLRITMSGQVREVPFTISR